MLIAFLYQLYDPPPAQLTAPGQLQELGPLIVGMKTETFLTLTSDRLLSSLPAMAEHTPGLTPPQANAISTKLWVQGKPIQPGQTS